MSHLCQTCFKPLSEHGCPDPERPGEFCKRYAFKARNERQVIGATVNHDEKTITLHTNQPEESTTDAQLNMCNTEKKRPWIVDNKYVKALDTRPICTHDDSSWCDERCFGHVEVTGPMHPNVAAQLSRTAPVVGRDAKGNILAEGKITAGVSRPAQEDTQLMRKLADQLELMIPIASSYRRLKRGFNCEQDVDAARAVLAEWKAQASPQPGPRCPHGILTDWNTCAECVPQHDSTEGDK